MTRYLLLLLLIALAGCNATPWSRRAARRSLTEQQQEAVVHDPYTDQSIAPEVVGGRPREYQKDFSEPQRSQLLHEEWLIPPQP